MDGEQTNIGDVAASTPSLILDAETGLLSNYYYERGRGILRRRVVDPDRVFGNPLNWPVSEAVAAGSQIPFDAGNVNATTIRDTHYLAFYSGQAPDTAILVSAIPCRLLRGNGDVSGHGTFCRRTVSRRGVPEGRQDS